MARTSMSSTSSRSEEHWMRTVNAIVALGVIAFLVGIGGACEALASPSGVLVDQLDDDRSDWDALERLLLKYSPLFGFDRRTIDHLLRTVRFEDWDGDEPSIAVGHGMPHTHLLIRGVGVVELRPDSTLITRSDPARGVLK